MLRILNGGSAREEEDDSSDIEIPVSHDYPSVNIAHRREFHEAAPKKMPSLLDRLTKEVVGLYNGIVAPTTSSSHAERADLGLTQQLDQMESMADEMLDMLAEYYEILEVTRNSTSVLLNTALPETFLAVQQISSMYGKIDRLEEIVDQAQFLADEMEKAVAQAETELLPSTAVTVKGFLRNLSPFALPRSRSDQRDWSVLKFYEPDVFVADRYLSVANDCAPASTVIREEAQEGSSKSRRDH
ncbi:hypothetical protein RvY_01150 [Ramazzottius varieornatus]|uniref:Biogenesis of lysosome-related organelles complex 1 subunit 4 n=1 Tax=Ramazzottius varieornatus TaxID=947166 RepID=A0A1D1UQ18_RAMVA|nr:hypothetical protein RvY_01150 [Ramazzottius varieornatus]